MMRDSLYSSPIKEGGIIRCIVKISSSFSFLDFYKKIFNAQTTLKKGGDLYPFEGKNIDCERRELWFPYM